MNRSVRHPIPPVAVKITSLPNSRTIIHPLTPAEIRTVDALAEHLCTYRRLAKILGVGIDTVKKQVCGAMAKTGTFSHLELVAKWRTKEFQEWLVTMCIREPLLDVVNLF